MKSGTKLIILFVIALLFLIIIPYFFIKNLSSFCELQLNAIYVYITFLIMLIALFGNTIWNWYYKPQIELEFKEEYPFIVETKERIWIRVKVKNKGSTAARKCEARLEKIFDVTSNELEIKEEFEKQILTWAHYLPTIRIDRLIGRIDTLPKDWITLDIAKEMDTFFYICYIYKKDKKIILFTSVAWPRFFQWMRAEKKLRFWVSVYGENIKPKSKKDIVIDIDEILKKYITQGNGIEPLKTEQ